METPYMVLVSETGAQLLCLSDGTRIPAQIDTCCTQTVDQASKGECAFTFSVYLKEDGLGVSEGCRMIDNWSLEMPDGRLCDVDYAIRSVVGSAPVAYCTVTAKMAPTTAHPLKPYAHADHA